MPTVDMSSAPWICELKAMKLRPHCPCVLHRCFAPPLLLPLHTGRSGSANSAPAEREAPPSSGLLLSLVLFLEGAGFLLLLPPVSTVHANR